jgi:gliding motility-associated-like protein
VEDCISEEVIYWVPNTFTPDGDQFNQTFKPVLYSGYDPYDYDFFIFNRWGELIWESHNVSFGWDGSYNEGRKCPDGVYTWKMNLKTMNNDEKIQVLGHVTLIR